jgi:outer membrane protein assembly factor BamD (BamD/ComL family)
MINGAKSANQQKLWQQAIDFAMPLTSTSADKETQNEAWFEIGQARMGLKREAGAIDAWQRASASTGKTGAHARVMKGDMLFKQKRFDEAIDEFKLVFYGYGGTESAPEIRSLQAYAVYESARCSYVRVSEASDRMKPQLVKDAIDRFTYLIENYPNQPLAKDAQKQLEILKQVEINPTNALR